MAVLTEKQKLLPSVASWLFVGGYFGLTFARSAGWIPESWSLIPIVETAWLNFLVVLAAIIWMRVKKIPLAHVGLGAFQPSRSLLMWVVGTMVIDSLAIGIATPALTSAFGEAPRAMAGLEISPNSATGAVATAKKDWPGSRQDPVGAAA